MAPISWADFGQTHERFWKDLVARPREEVCASSGASLTSDGAFTVQLAGEAYIVDAAGRKVYSESGKDADFEAALVLVTYLASASHVFPSRQWVSPRNFPQGDAFFRGIHEMPLQGLVDLLQSNQAGLERAVRVMGGRQSENGDMAFEVDALPKVSLRFHLWRGDEEFGPTAQVLLDRTADRFLLLDGMRALVKLTVKRLVTLSGSA